MLPKETFTHPNTMTAKLLAGNETLYELEYYSVGGGFIEWKGYKPPDKGQPKYPFSHAKDLKKYLFDDKILLPTLLLENEMAISGKNEKQIWEFLDQVAEVMIRGVDTGLKRGKCSSRPDQAAQQSGRHLPQLEELQQRPCRSVPLVGWRLTDLPWVRKTLAAISS